MGFIKGGSGFDWNGNGKIDAFDNYMDMKLSSETDDDITSDDCDVDIDKNDTDLDFDDCVAISNDDNSFWREKYQFDVEHDIDLDDYETEEEYLEAIEDSENENTGISHIYSSHPSSQKKHTPPELSVTASVSVYNYCKVSVDSVNKIYDYLMGEHQLNINDKVLIPFGAGNTKGTVVAIGKCLESAFPCSINQMKMIIQPLERANVCADRKKEEAIFEDDNIKISFVKWSRDNYWIGGIARTGTFVFENKTDKRICIYMKDVTVCGFLNIEESTPTTLSGNQKAMNSIPFVYESRIPTTASGYKTIEFNVCYGTIREGFSSISFIDKPVTESNNISINV